MKTNKEFKEEYKQKKFRIGVFQIRNIINNKVFIDGSMDLEKIFNRHKMQLNYGNHQNAELQKDWRSFGEEKFVFEILGELDQNDESADFAREVRLLKKMHIDELEPLDERAYNRKSPLHN